MGEIKLVFNSFTFKIYGREIIALSIIVFLLIGITIYLVRKEIANDK